MELDPIVEEVRKARQNHAEKFDFNLDAICKDLMEQEKTCGHPVVSLSPRPLLKKAG